MNILAVFSYFLAKYPFYISAVFTVITLTYYALLYRWIQKKHQPVKPVAANKPPAKLSPSALRFLYLKRFDKKCFSAHIIQWAIDGHVTINSHDIYENCHMIHKKNKDYTEPFFKKFFGRCTEREVSQRYLQPVGALKKQLYKSIKPYLSLYFELWLVGILLSVTAIIPVFLIEHLSWFFLAVGLFYVNMFAKKFLTVYSAEGEKVVAQIKGFKRYLSDADLQSEETAQFYETYLAYTVALECEEQWARAHKSHFKSGPTFIPAWYSSSDVIKNETVAPFISKSLTQGVKAKVK